MDKYKFKYPPILVGGKAMEYYNLRKTGHDIDYIISKYDYNKLSKIQEKIINNKIIILMNR